ncbi:ATP-binding protein [Niallia sp. Krafla_26]|uniref:sensor histidine kinase n=1 Tax=Niallia sp. Krafla_26 TaxID=3064703 RepID=UPI003D173358
MKLQTKLTIAFISIVLLMGLSQSIFLQSKIQDTFQNYLDRQNIGYLERMKQNLTLFYEETGSWENVQQVYFNEFTGNEHGMMMRGNMNSMNMHLPSADLLLLDTRGTVIADTTGTRNGESSTNFNGKKSDITIDGKKVGTLLLYQSGLQSLEKEFILSSNLAIINTSIIAALIAVLLSIWITKKITKPLKELTKRTKQITRGEKWTPVTISTKDEWQELGDAYNEMAVQLAKNEEVRQTLVADVAHELRTPLTILQGELESIQEGVKQPNEEVILKLIDEVYRLKRLVNDLQQLSLAEAGKLPLHKHPVQIKELIERICGNFQWLADEKQISLRYDQISEDVWLEIDPDRITQVVVNLVGNALRHTPNHGLVEITGYEGDDSFILKVSDNGPGIPKDTLPFIFERFYKRDLSRSRSESGTGLGLSIAKGYVEAHGGTIAVDSEINKGTTFTVVLPSKLEHKKDEEP